MTRPILQKAVNFDTSGILVKKIPYTSVFMPGFGGGNRGGTYFFEKLGILRPFFRVFRKKKREGAE